MSDAAAPKLDPTSQVLIAFAASGQDAIRLAALWLAIDPDRRPKLIKVAGVLASHEPGRRAAAQVAIGQALDFIAAMDRALP